MSVLLGAQFELLLDADSSYSTAQWYLDGTAIVSGTNGSYIVPSFGTADAGQYQAYLDYNGTDSAYSLPITLSPARVAMPYFSPEPARYAGTVDVQVLSSTRGATLFYTTDGSDPTPSSGTYDGIPLVVNANTVLKAYGTKTGFLDSYVGTGTYEPNVTQLVASIAPASGSYVGYVAVELTSNYSGTGEGLAIFYTVDGSDPSSASTLYTGLIPLQASATVKAISYQTGQLTSAVVSSTYSVYPFTVSPSRYYRLDGTLNDAMGVADLTMQPVNANLLDGTSFPANENFLEGLAYDSNGQLGRIDIDSGTLFVQKGSSDPSAADISLVDGSGNNLYDSSTPLATGRVTEVTGPLIGSGYANNQVSTLVCEAVSSVAITTLPGTTYEWLRGSGFEYAVNGTGTITQDGRYVAAGTDITVYGTATGTANVVTLREAATEFTWGTGVNGIGTSATVADYAEYADGAPFDVSSAVYTIAGWVRTPAVLSSGSTMFVLQQPDAVKVYVSYSSDWQLTGVFYNTSPSTQDVLSEPLLADSWYFFVVSHDGTTPSVSASYVGAGSVSTPVLGIPADQAFDATRNFILGKDPADGSASFAGHSLAHIGLYPASLSQEELRGIYDLNRAGLPRV